MDPTRITSSRFFSVGLWILVGLIHGLIYVFLIPPWQHYDEPGHFEYAWLIANQPGRPAPGEYNQAMRREVAASMIETGFFKETDSLPNLVSIYEPVWIGISQTDDSPLYYWIVSLPLRLVSGSDVALQLTLGRLVSLLFYLGIIAAAYGITVELTTEKHPLRWMVPAAAALLPGFTDLMTAFNNDAGAALFFSLYLWAGVRLIQKGFSWKRAAAAVILALLSAFTKNTAAAALLLLPIPVLFSILRGERQRWAWLGMGAAALIILLTFFRWDEARQWYRSTPHIESTRVRHPGAPYPPFAFELTNSGQAPLDPVIQLVPADDMKPLQGKMFSLGAWIWADEVMQINAPVLRYRDASFGKAIEVSTEPEFYAFSAVLPAEYASAQIILLPWGATPGKETRVYYDGIVLAEGERPDDAPPVFYDREGQQGEWGGERFANLARNGSANRGWLRMRPELEKRLDSFFPDKPSYIFAALGDLHGSAWYHTNTGRYLFHTFWGMFGWGNVPLYGFHPYRILGLFTGLGLIGAAVITARKWNTLPLPALLLLALSAATIWFFAWFRGISSITWIIFIPSARYAYPAFIATVLPLAAGWYEILRLTAQGLSIRPHLARGFYLLFFILLDLAALIGIARYFY
jgi:hypothetical protein